MTPASVSLAPPQQVVIAAPGLNLQADLYLPPADVLPAPGVVLLHGWAQPWQRPAQAMRPFALGFQRAGFAVVVPAMRGWRPTGGADDCAHRQVGDAIAAAHWLGGRPGVDARRLHLVGYSQGGQVALLAAARRAPVRAVAAFAPVVDPATWGRETDTAGIRDYLQQECGGPAGWGRRSVLSEAGAIRQPLLLVHGAIDRRVPTSQSVRLFEALRRRDHPVRLVLLPHTDHAIDQALRPDLATAFFHELDTPAPSQTRKSSRRPRQDGS